MVFVNTENLDILDVSIRLLLDSRTAKYIIRLYMVSQCNTNVIGAYEHEVRVCAKFKSHLADKI